MDKFLSNENKALLWQFLTDQGAFNNIHDKYVNHVKTTYESVLTGVAKMTHNSLTDKNKLVLSEMQKSLSLIPHLNQETIKRKTSPLLKPLEEVKIQLNRDYQNKQEEFIQLVNHNKPKEIEFSDKEDTPLGTEVMNNMLNNMMNMRERELMQVNPLTRHDSIRHDSIKSDSIKSDSIKRDIISHEKTNRDSCVDYMWSSFGNETNKKLDKERKSLVDTDNFMSRLKTKKPEPELEPEPEPELEPELELEPALEDVSNDKYDKILENQQKMFVLLNEILQKLDS